MPEDFALGLCLSRIDVSFIFGVDKRNKLLFTPVKLDHLLRGQLEQVQLDPGGLAQGFVDLDLGSSPGWWAATVATYCPSRMVELRMSSTASSTEHYIFDYFGSNIRLFD